MKTQGQDAALGVAQDYMDRNPTAEPYYVVDEDGYYVIDPATDERMIVRLSLSQSIRIPQIADVPSTSSGSARSPSTSPTTKQGRSLTCVSARRGSNTAAVGAAATAALGFVAGSQCCLVRVFAEYFIRDLIDHAWDMLVLLYRSHTANRRLHKLFPRTLPHQLRNHRHRVRHLPSHVTLSHSEEQITAPHAPSTSTCSSTSR